MLLQKNYLAGFTNSPIPIPENFPMWIKRGSGPYIYDYKGNQYIDLWMGYGALLFGHADKEIIEVIQETIRGGWFFSNPPLIELEVAEIIHNTIPSAECVRYATTGSDAVAYSLRAARSFTNRKKILTVIGGYHGVHEGVIPSRGVVDEVESLVDFVPFNDVESLEKKLRTKEYAAFILEPILANSGCTPPENNYLSKVRELCNSFDTILIFDEIVTGLRIHNGGAQTYYNVVPDMSLFSKAIANGLPLSVVCGKRRILEQFLPLGNVFFAGTFNGHPLSLSVAKHVFTRIEHKQTHEKMKQLGDKLRNHIKSQIDYYEIEACVQGLESMLTVAFGCTDFPQGLKVKQGFQSQKYTRFVQLLSKNGVVFPPLQTETVFLSVVHEQVLEKIEEAITKSFEELVNETN